MTLDPILAARLPLIADIDPAVADEKVAARFAKFAAPVAGYRAPQAESEDVLLAGPHGPVSVRVYWPSNSGSPSDKRPGLVWMHGGAFVSGDLNMVESDVVAREVCVRAGAIVVSVDYRLAGAGVHHPVPLDDVLAAWRWTHANAQPLGLDPQRLAAGGASAGACLAASTALRLRADAQPTPAALLLAYPTVHRALPPPSVELSSKLDQIPPVFRFPAAAVTRMNRTYLGNTGYAAHAMPGDEPLAGLPPTLVVTCEYDDLRSSGEAFAASLAAAGVPTTLRCEPGMLHGHLNLPGLPGAIATVDAMVTHLLAAGPDELARDIAADDARALTSG